MRDVLAHAPAPRIVLLQGSVAFVTMEPFARFLVGMGYPADRLRNPRDGSFSYSSFADSAALAGALAFDYEQSGVEPMLIGHSQGGMLASGRCTNSPARFTTRSMSSIPTGVPCSRTTIVDPHTQQPPSRRFARRLCRRARDRLAAALVLGQWTMLSRMRKIPDTVTEFTGFILPHDPIAGNLLGDRPYEAIGHAQVRNVVLPPLYGHRTAARRPLADDLALRAWIDAGRPTSRRRRGGDTSNLVHAADIWYSVKRHWCSQAQGLLTCSRHPDAVYVRIRRCGFTMVLRPSALLRGVDCGHESIVEEPKEPDLANFSNARRAKNRSQPLAAVAAL